MFLDQQMPKLNGIQVLERVRRFCNLTNANEGIKVVEPVFIFLTAFSTQTFKSHLKSLEVEHCYEKPLQLDQLERII